MSINVLHIITGLPIGGAEKVLLDLCANLDKNSIKNYVIGLNDEDDFCDDFLQNGVEVKILNMNKGLISFLKCAKIINRYIKDKKIDIIHVHMFHPLIFAFISRLRYPDIKVVFTSHNVNIGSKFREVVTFLLKPFRDVDILFSKSMMRYFYKKSSVVIPNGIDITPYLENVKKNKIYTFISVGVLRYQKNQLFLPYTADYLKKNGISNFQIQVVGGPDASGDMREEINSEIKKYGVEDEIKMLGARRDIPELLKKAHCFVMPSHFEGLPIALLEAGAANLSVVSTPVGAIPSVIDKDSGYLSDLDNFAKTMLYVITNQEESQQKAKNLQQKIFTKFSIKSMANSFEEVYKNLLNG